MRPLLFCLIASGLMEGCGCSETGLEGHADSTVNPDIDHLAEPDGPADIPDEEPAIGHTCGNGIIEPGEECDDGDIDDCNGCSADCRWERAMRIGAHGTGAVAENSIAPGLPSPFTIEAWFRIDAEDGYLAFIRQSDCISYSMSFHDGEGLYSYFFTGDMGGVGISNVPLSGFLVGTWHHLAIVFGPSEVYPECYSFTHYFDGTDHEEETSSLCHPAMWGCAGSLLLGVTSSGYPPGSFSLDEVRISNEIVYSSDFTPEERLAPRYSTVAMWDFDQEADGVIPDLSGNGHDAVLVDGTLVPDDCHMP